MNFLSDNAATVCPEVIDAILAANAVTGGAYDGDPITARLDEVFGRPQVRRLLDAVQRERTRLLDPAG